MKVGLKSGWLVPVLFKKQFTSKIPLSLLVEDKSLFSGEGKIESLARQLWAQLTVGVLTWQKKKKKKQMCKRLHMKCCDSQPFAPFGFLSIGSLLYTLQVKDYKSFL